MRLIDADAFIQRLREDCEDKATMEYIAEIHDLLEIEATFHPVDAEPVRHGKLMRTEAYPHRLYCSECFKTLIRNEEICFEKNEFPKYCMWCGAKMEGAEG